MKKILITLFVVLGMAYWLLGQCPSVDYLATDGPGFIDLSPPQNSPCMAMLCDEHEGTASIEFPDLGSPFDLVIVAPFPISVVWHKTDCDSILLVQCLPTSTSGDTMVFGLNVSEYRIATLYSDTIGEIWAVVSPSTSLPQAMPFYCQGQMPLSTDDSRETTKVIYKRMDNGLLYETPLPAGMYFLLYSETLFPAGRKILVVE